MSASDVISRYDPRPAYLNDPTFRRMVDTIRHVLRDGYMTPGEVRSAAVYACTLHEAENLSRPYFIEVRRELPEGDDDER